MDENFIRRMKVVFLPFKISDSIKFVLRIFYGY